MTAVESLPHPNEFRAADPGLRALVVDDVMTTGASLDEFARTLKRAGAASVENWVVARTPTPGGG